MATEDSVLARVDSERHRRGKGPVSEVVWDVVGATDPDCVAAVCEDPNDHEALADLLSAISRIERAIAGRDVRTEASKVRHPLGPRDYEWQRADALSEHLALEAEHFEPHPSALRNGRIREEFSPRVFREAFTEGRWLTDEEAYAFCNSRLLQRLPVESFRQFEIPFLGHRLENATEIPPTLRHQKEGTATFRVSWEGGAIEVTHSGTRTYPGPEYFVPRQPGIGDLPSLCYPARGDTQDPWEYRVGQGWSPPSRREEPVWDGTVLCILWKLVERLRYRLPWDDAAEIAWYVLTGATPKIHPLTWQIDAEHPAAGTKPIRITVAPWVRAATVLRAYREIQRELLGKENTPFQSRGLSLVQFVSKHRRRNEKISWAELRSQWNDSVQDPKWRFDGEGEQRMIAEYCRIRDAITRPTKRDLDYWKRSVKPTPTEADANKV